MLDANAVLAGRDVVPLPRAVGGRGEAAGEEAAARGDDTGAGVGAPAFPPAPQPAAIRPNAITAATAMTGRRRRGAKGRETDLTA